MSTRIRHLLWASGLFGLLSSSSWAVDVDAALDAAKRPKKDADRAEVADTAKAAQADMQRRIDDMDSERRRRRDALVDKFIDRSALSAGTSSNDTNQTAGNYKIYKDKGRAADWAWFRQEVVLKCEGGRENGSMPSVYLMKSGQWNYGNRYLSTFHEAARVACGA